MSACRREVHAGEAMSAASPSGPIAWRTAPAQLCLALALALVLVTPTLLQAQAGFWCANGQLLTGDFNGDGRTDQLCYGPAGVTRVSLAIPQGFAPPVDWLSGYVFNHIIVGDFNGDGRTDIADYTGDYFFVALSTGTGFTTPVSWGH